MKAHIMPRSLLMSRTEVGKHNYLLSTRHDFAMRSPTGVYDSNLVCDKCEAIFGPYDDYGHEFFKLEHAVKLVSPEMESLGWVCSVDYSKFKLFILSIMWRASASDRPECASVKLGQFQEPIRQMIKSGDPGPADRFPIVLQRYEQDSDMAPLSMPRRARLSYSSVNYYKMELAGCAVWVAIDERRVPTVFNDLMLAPGRDARLLPADYRTTGDFKKMAATLRRIRAKTGRYPVV